ncbi:uncharacterized protein LOC120160324 [Hibiscus syriacus]|uniref:uncharacterized protein LOC120160324 n=1 Tax=Hibiscus syriacus TaxID=106335 RepID=UPI001923FB94|nr:uncharacterized protein LOC120160324 [Hibiscus syriacus]
MQEISMKQWHKQEREANPYKTFLMNNTIVDRCYDEDILDDEDIEIQEGEVVRSIIDGLILIDFSDRINSLAAKSLDQTVVLKLLGRRIGYNTLKSKICELWKPKLAIKLMDDLWPLLDCRTMDGRVFAIKSVSEEDHGLDSFTWSTETLYKRSIITEIGECIGRVIRLGYQTESGRVIARLTINIDLNKPLISKLVVNGRIQIVEYEALPAICFSCGKYGHLQDSCPSASSTQKHEETVAPQADNSAKKDDSMFGSCMIFEK